MTAHHDLTGADLHEPKGVSTATSGQVYRADGLGSGSWQSITIPSGLFSITFAEFTASGTWTKPAGLFKVRVHVIGSGGHADGAGVNTDGGTSQFGAHCSATGGKGDGSVAGTGTNGNINLTGQVGWAGYSPGGSPVHGAGGLSGGPFPGKGSGNQSLGGAGGVPGAAGGGYAMKEIATASLGATETVTMGATGANNGYVLVEQYLSI